MGLPHELRGRGEHAERLRRAELAREDPLGAEAGELRRGLLRAELCEEECGGVEGRGVLGEALGHLVRVRVRVRVR